MLRVVENSLNLLQYQGPNKQPSPIRPAYSNALTTSVGALKHAYCTKVTKLQAMRSYALYNYLYMFIVGKSATLVQKR